MKSQNSFILTLLLATTLIISCLLIFLYSSRNSKTKIPTIASSLTTQSGEILNEIYKMTSNWKTYTNTADHFTIKYPQTIKTINSTDAIPGFIPICDPNFLVCLHYPESLIPNTNFTGGGLSVYKLNEKNTSSKCSTFENSDDFKVSKSIINGVKFYQQNRGTAATGHQEISHYYRSFYKNNCLEIILRITTESRVENMPTKSGYNPFTKDMENEVFSTLTQILSTFHLTE